MLDFYYDSIKPTHSWPLTPNKHRQELPFHLLDIGTFYMGEKYYTCRDSLNNYLLLITTDGCGRIHWKGKNCHLPAGSAVLIDCNIYHEYRTVPRQHWFFDFIHFGALSMEGYQSVLLNTLTPVKLRSPAEMKKIFMDLGQLTCFNNVAGDAIMSHQISGMLTEMISSLPADKEGAQVINRPDIAALADFIRKYFMEDLHIDDFMKITNLSRHYLIHIFEQQIGMSPYRYLHMCRVDYAQKLLTTTDMSISEIAYSIGYNSTAVFIRHFKSVHGVSPGTYRSNSVRMME